MPQDVRDLQFRVDVDSFQHRAFRQRWTLYKHGAEQGGRGADDVRQLAQFHNQLAPVFDAVAILLRLDINVRRRTEQILLQLVAEPVVHR